MKKLSRIIIPILIVSISFILYACPQQGETGQNGVQESNKLLLVEYNVENLFDIVDDPAKSDEDFTPQGKNQWTEERYQKKLSDISKVIYSVRERAPELIALIEIENKTVLEALLKTEQLNKNYAIVHQESPDSRGIDVALIYNTDKFKELSHQAIRVFSPDDTKFLTRDILYTKLLVKKKDTLHLFVNHWPSRRGGEEDSEAKRVLAATILRAKVDSLQSKNPDAKILITGDMNDEPANKSMLEVLKANNAKENSAKTELYNLMYDKKAQGEGTYLYKDNWNMLDNVIVSQSFFKNNGGVSCNYNSAEIFKPDWILFENQKTKIKSPSRTYGGPNYYGGYSDHLPLYLEMTFE